MDNGPLIGNGFWQEGIRFERLEEGSVHIIAGEIEYTISAESWAEVVAFVSQGGDTARNIQQALAFHQDSL